MSNLDSQEALALDGQALLRSMDGSATAIRESRAAAGDVAITFPAEEVRNAVLCGMGGSAIAGDIVASALNERFLKPFAVVRDYYLPGWVGEHTLVIVSSYSGTTEETLTCTLEATERRSLVVGISSGGKIAGEYANQGIPVVPVPRGLQPRAALLRMLPPVVVILQRMGVIADSDPDLDEAQRIVAAGVKALRPEVRTTENPAKQLARELHGFVPLIWGSEVSAAVARRWKTQINENVEVPAFWGELPEVDHNEIVGFQGMGGLGPLLKVVGLTDTRQHRQVQRRFELTGELIRDSVAGVLTISPEGGTPLARALDLVLLGDYTALYMALLRDVDPGPVEIIESLKSRLATSPFGRAADRG